MKIGRKELLRLMPVVCFAALLAFNGCEGTTEDDDSGVDAYLAAHPYVSASRDTPLAPELTISPVQATASIVGQTIAFAVSGGEGSYHWGVSDPADGMVDSKGANSALYTCLQVGNNDVIVQDDGGHYAAAHISPVAAVLTISPATASLAGGAVYVSLAVSGGKAGYVWTAGNTNLGSVTYSAGSSQVAAYTAVAGVYGQNIVTVKDAEGLTASATITQAP